MRGNDMWNDPNWARLRKRINKTHPESPRQAVNHNQLNHSNQPQKATVEPQNSSEAHKKVSVSLNLTVPKLPRLKLTKKRKKIGLATAGVAVVALAGFGAFKVLDKPKSTEVTDVLADNVTEPEFDTVLPSGKKEETEGNNIGYDSQRKVASFKDTIGSVPITVSQQPLPEPFKANPDEEVKKLAEGFSATNAINESNPKAYLGNDESGAQTVIFHKNNVLVFMFSPKQIDKDQWAEYITKLL